MKYIILLIPLLFGQLFPLYAQQQDDKGDKKSSEILDNLTRQTQSYTSINAEFTYKMQNAGAKIDETKTGKITLKGDKYRLNIAGQLVICDGITVWTYIEDANEVQVNSLEENDETLTPSNLFSSYNVNYKSNFVKEAFQYGTTVYIIDLTPFEKKSFNKVRLIIDKAKLHILEFSIFDKSGSTFSYIINKFVTNQPVQESDFIFKVSSFPGVEVIDMR